MPLLCLSLSERLLEVLNRVDDGEFADITGDIDGATWHGSRAVSFPLTVPTGAPLFGEEGGSLNAIVHVNFVTGVFSCEGEGLDLLRDALLAAGGRVGA